MSHVPAPPPREPQPDGAPGGYPDAPVPGGYPGGPPAAGGYMPAPQPAGAGSGPRPPLPSTMKAAVAAMVLGGVIQLISPLFVFLDMDAVREKADEGSAGTLTPEQLDAAVTIGIVLGIGLAVFGAVLWFLSAFLNAKGYAWARIVATCFAAIGIFLALVGLLQDNPAATKILNVLLALVGVLAAVLLWLPASSRWFRSAR